MSFSFSRILSNDYHINFLKQKWLGLTTSACLSILSIALLFHPGLKLGLDFKGGVAIEVQSSKPISPDQIRSTLIANHIVDASVQRFGSENDARIAVAIPSNITEQNQKDFLTQVQQAIKTNLPDVQIQQSDIVGAAVSQELFRNGLLALFLSLAMIFAYIWIRFEKEFAAAAVVTLLLDLTKTMGFIILAGFEFDLIMVAALLTILGYSTNDKIVVYDRIRENLRLSRKKSFETILNESINETLGRTIATSSTLFLASLPLAIFGGHTLTGFASVMLFGIVVGTSSSIFIGAPILYLLGQKRFGNKK